LLKHSDFIVGNSSVGIREASVYGIPSVNIGRRQQGRVNKNGEGYIVNSADNSNEIVKAIQKANKMQCEPESFFGNGSSDQLFIDILEGKHIWETDFQKSFVDII
jgi:UDP-N-acetylglucosamine 2-epimerase (hydrolysing)